MPPVTAVAITPDRLTIGTKECLVSDIPVTARNTPTKLEAALAAQFDQTNYDVRVHVFSLAPLHYTVGTWNKGSSIPANWWEQ